MSYIIVLLIFPFPHFFQRILLLLLLIIHVNILQVNREANIYWDQHIYRRLGFADKIFRVV